MRHIERAIHDTVMHTPSMTCEEIAARLGRGAQVLRNKANPDQEGHITGCVVARVQEVLGGRMTLQIQSNCTKSIDAAIDALTELRRAVANHKDGLRAA